MGDVGAQHFQITGEQPVRACLNQRIADHGGFHRDGDHWNADAVGDTLAQQPVLGAPTICTVCAGSWGLCPGAVSHSLKVDCHRGGSPIGIRCAHGFEDCFVFGVSLLDVVGPVCHRLA